MRAPCPAVRSRSLGGLGGLRSAPTRSAYLFERSSVSRRRAPPRQRSRIGSRELRFALPRGLRRPARVPPTLRPPECQDSWTLALEYRNLRGGSGSLPGPAPRLYSRTLWSLRLRPLH